MFETPGRKGRLARAGLAAMLVATAGYSAAEGLPELDCVIKPAMTIDLSSPVAGIIDTISVDRSDPVTQGQIVASLRSGVERVVVSLAAAKARYNGQIELRKAEYDYAETQRKRAIELYKKKAITFQVMDEAVRDAIVAKKEAQQAEHDKHLAQLELRYAQEMLDLRIIRSPINGVVVDRYVSPGERVDAEPVLTLAQLDPLHVEMVVPLAYRGSIVPGLQATIIPEGNTGAAYKSTVSLVDSVIDAPSGTFRVRINLPNPEGTIPGGVRCKALIE